MLETNTASGELVGQNTVPTRKHTQTDEREEILKTTRATPPEHDWSRTETRKLTNLSNNRREKIVGNRDRRRPRGGLYLSNK